MRKPGSGWFAASFNRALGPLACPEYRRLLLLSHVLLTRARLLNAALTIIEPIATPGSVRLLRRWHQSLKTDVAAFYAALRARNIPKWSPASTATPPVTTGEFQNPWL